MQQLHLLEHPLMKHKLGYLRDQSTNPADFRRIVSEISWFLAYAATTDLDLTQRSIQSPIAETNVERVAEWPSIISLMRAGNGMLPSISEFLPKSKIGHIGIYRDRFIDSTVEYYLKIPEGSSQNIVLLADLLIGSGDTAIASVDRLKKFGAKDIRILCILASKRGLENLFAAHADISVYAVEAEDELNDGDFLNPGLGDIGIRYFDNG